MPTPRDDYPRPQFARDDWLCLNGTWEFEIDHGDCGLEKGYLNRPFSQQIIVPFCPESELSGVGCKDFMDAVWYRREVRIPEDWRGKKVLLHFQAVDYATTVWVNGVEVARHKGGWTGFACDLSKEVGPGDTAVIVVRARDLKGDTGKPGGKQCNDRYDNHGCYYSRTTGIWQSVWMEPVHEIHLQRSRITPDVTNRRFIVEQPITNSRGGVQLRISLKDDRGIVTTVTQRADGDFTPTVDLAIPGERVHYWSPNAPFLYDLDIELLGSNAGVIDRVQSYAGLRSITIDGKAIKLNGERIFQRLVLDQGYYPDGVMTAGSDEILKRDVELALDAGFNGARLHQKVFEERFLYHCDRLGYLVWADFGDWGIDRECPKATYITQWLEVLRRDYSHPSIVGWCGLNETGQHMTDHDDELSDLTMAMFLAAKAFDMTRPVLDASGHAHRVAQTDVYDSHCYVQDPEALREIFAGLRHNEAFANSGSNRGITNGTSLAKSDAEEITWSLPYNGQPYFCSEFGGIKWCNELAEEHCRETSWGYGAPLRSLEEFYLRFGGLCKAMLDNPCMFGYCYTQLTDVSQERNGIYYADRRPKFDLKRIRKIQQQKAAIEAETERVTDLRRMQKGVGDTKAKGRDGTYVAS